MEYVVEVRAGYEVVFDQAEVTDFRFESDGTLVIATAKDETRFYPETLVRWFQRTKAEQPS